MGSETCCHRACFAVWMCPEDACLIPTVTKRAYQCIITMQGEELLRVIQGDRTRSHGIKQGAFKLNIIKSLLTVWNLSLLQREVESSPHWSAIMGKEQVHSKQEGKQIVGNNLLLSLRDR